MEPIEDELKKTAKLIEEVEPVKSFKVSTQPNTGPDSSCTARLDRSSSRSFLNTLGLWLALLAISFVLSAAFIPIVFLKGISDAAFAVLVFLEGGISCSATLGSKFLWHIFSKNRMSRQLKFVVVLWLPALLSQFLYLIPGSLVRVSNNDNSLVDFAFNIMIYLILPSLIGSSIALAGLKIELWSRRTSNLNSNCRAQRSEMAIWKHSLKARTPKSNS